MFVKTQSRKNVNFEWASVVAPDSNVVDGWSNMAEAAAGRESRIKENPGDESRRAAEEESLVLARAR